jgi:hypothetical protein
VALAGFKLVFITTFSILMWQKNGVALWRA